MSYNPENNIRERLEALSEEVREKGGLADVLEPEDEQTSEEQEDAQIIETFLENGWLLTSKSQLDSWAKKGTSFIGVDYALFAEVLPHSDTNDIFYFYKTIKRGGKIENLPDTTNLQMDAKLRVYRVERKTQEDVDKAVREKIFAGGKIPRGSDQEILAPTHLTEMVFENGEWVAMPFTDLEEGEIDEALGKLTPTKGDTAPDFVPLSSPPKFTSPKNKPDFDPFADTHLQDPS
ncbi:MAG: hypothetical protein V1848_03300 [Candidatus Magasanikbacteria bacterium]